MGFADIDLDPEPCINSNLDDTNPESIVQNQ